MGVLKFKDGSNWVTIPALKGTDGTNGKGITSIVKTGTVGLVDTYRITYTDATTQDYTITNGDVGDPGTDGTDGTTELTFAVPGTLTVGSGTMRWYMDASKTISNVLVSVGTAPTGARLIVDVNKNGSTIFTSQANRPTITASGFYDLANAPDVTSVASGDYLTVDIDQIGSTIAGADLVVRIKVI